MITLCQTAVQLLYAFKQVLLKLSEDSANLRFLHKVNFVAGGCDWGEESSC